MSDVTGSRDFVAYGDQQQRPPDEQPERIVMRGPDGRTVQVMTEDVAGFEERGFVPTEQSEQAVEAPVKPKRQKVTPTAPEEAS